MIQKIELLLTALENKIPDYEHYNPEISGSNTGWHIEHALLTIDRIIERLSQTKSSDYKWKINFSKIYVFTTRKIPRGRAKAPEQVRPKDKINPESLTRHMATTKEKVKALNRLPSDQYFEHPYFGHLKLKQTIKFLEIHTLHHLKIIQEI
jgi:hypothetical protein